MTNPRCKQCGFFKSPTKPCKVCARKEKEEDLGTAAIVQDMVEGIKFVTRSRLFRMAFWPWSKIYEDRLIKKARKQLNES